MIAGILIGIVAGLLANELCEFSPWCARKLVRWSAFRRYTDPDRAEMRAEELTAVINDRPGNLFKLITAVGFAAGAVIASDRRAVVPEDVWARVHQAGDAVRRSVNERDAAQMRARQARDFHLALQAEYPHRHAPLLQQALIAAFTVGLEAVGCWFAVQALGNGQAETLLWTVLFLAVLAAGEVGLDYASERSSRVWRLLSSGLLVFVAGLGTLRFLYLVTVGADGTVAALVGAGAPGR